MIVQLSPWDTHKTSAAVGKHSLSRRRTIFFPFAELSKHDTPFRDEFAGHRLTVHFDADNRTGRVLDESGSEIPTVIAFWFAWVAFHPDTEVFEAS